MPQFLITSGVSHHLEKIISNAKEKLFLISPYLQINPHLRLLLQDDNINSIDAHIVYGKSKENEDLKWIKGHTKIDIGFYETLHAKCYLNEQEAIITSMNLYQYSQQNNCEMGVLFTLKDDPALYGDTLKEAERIIRQSESIHSVRSDIKKDQNPIIWTPKKNAESPKQHHGYCIRTGTQIMFNLEKPLCSNAYHLWSQYCDEYYSENYCHFSGEESNGETCYAKPIMRKNWKKAQRVFHL